MLEPAPSGADLDDGALGPHDRPDARRWLATAAIGYIVGELLAVVFATVAAAIAGTKGGLSHALRLPVAPMWLVASELVGLWIGFGGAAWVVTRSGRSVGLRIHRSDASFVVVGLALQGLLYLVYTSLLHVGGTSKAANQLLGAGSGWLLIVPGCMTVLLVPVFEELFFRGVLLRALVSLLGSMGAVAGVALAVVLDGIVFGIAHLGSDPWAELPGLAVVGIVLATLAVRTRRLGPSIVTHASFNLVAVIAFAATR